MSNHFRCFIHIDSFHEWLTSGFAIRWTTHNQPSIVKSYQQFSRKQFLRFFTVDYIKIERFSMWNIKPQTIINIQHLEITCFYGFLIWVMSDTYVYYQPLKACIEGALTTFVIGDAS